jgi:TonB family protein
MQRPNRVAASGLILALMFLVAGSRSTNHGLTRSNQVPPEWKRYTVRNEEFSILLPELPAMMTSVETVRVGTNRRIRVLGAYMDDVVYSIYTFENPTNQSLEDLVRQNYFLQRQDNQIESQRELTLNGFHGREFVVTTGNSSDVMQFWKTAKNLYVLRTVSPKEVPTSTGDFFSSLLLGPKQTGEEVNDGPGAQSDEPDPAGATPENSNDVLRILPSKVVTRKVIVGSKPEPSYTEDARRNQITGTVVLKVVFNGKGQVTNINVVSGLPHGLTERAVAAARQIRFIPAVKDGRKVSMWMQLEYNFNLY